MSHVALCHTYGAVTHVALCHMWHYVTCGTVTPVALCDMQYCFTCGTNATHMALCHTYGTLPHTWHYVTPVALCHLWHYYILHMWLCVKYVALCHTHGTMSHLWHYVNTCGTTSNMLVLTYWEGHRWITAMRSNSMQTGYTLYMWCAIDAPTTVWWAHTLNTLSDPWMLLEAISTLALHSDGDNQILDTWKPQQWLWPNWALILPQPASLWDSVEVW